MALILLSIHLLLATYFSLSTIRSQAEATSAIDLSCGVSSAPISPLLITNGNESVNGRWPWMVQTGYWKREEKTHSRLPVGESTVMLLWYCAVNCVNGRSPTTLCTHTRYQYQSILGDGWGGARTRSSTHSFDICAPSQFSGPCLPLVVDCAK